MTYPIIKHFLKRIRSQKTSTAPIRPVTPAPSSLTLSVVEYDESQLIEKEHITIEECLESIDKPIMTWVQVYGTYDSTLVNSLGNHFKLHPLVLEDILNQNQRSKIETYDNQIFIVSRVLIYNEQTRELLDKQLSLILGPNYLISFLAKDEGAFKPIKERIEQGKRIRKQGSDYLAYALLDLVVDHYFTILEKIDANLDQLEAELSHSSSPKILGRIQHAKRDMIFLRKSVWPMRDVINRFQHLDSPLVTANTQLYLRDIYDHVIQVIDVIEGFRDVVSGMLDIYLSNINIRTNEIMKVLTIVSTIFVPLTFISSLYGMNFDYMPELHSQWGYPIAVFFMAAVAFVMLIYFRRKKWI
jgi:magnesium transporter